MQLVKLASTGMATSALGFGTAQLMARVSLRESLNLLGAAFDSGITHFDTARLYGYGEAERAVGRFIKGRRERVTVATKFGIFPPKRSPLLQGAKAVARALARLHPGIRQRMRARAGTLVTSGRFSVADAQRSLETSLKELGTDYVDVLFLHDCRSADLEAADELARFLDDALQRGLIRAYGVATDVESVSEALRRFPAFARVVQFPSDAANQNAGRLRREHTFMLTHSPLGGVLGQVLAYLSANDEAASQWANALGVDCRDSDALARLLVRAARYDNPRGIVLFASTSAQRIAANARASEAVEDASRQALELARLLRSSPFAAGGRPRLVTE